jgi:hypothetical protein
LSGQKGRDAVKTQRKKGKGNAAPIYRHPLLESISSYLACLSRMKDPAAKRQVKWTPQAAATAAVLMALGGTLALQVRCDDALTCLAQEPRRRALGKTYNGLIKALVRQADKVLPVVKDHLRRETRKALGRMEKTGGWTLLAVDGSKEDLPRTVAHEKHFGIADNGRCPQAFVTAIVEVHTRLLWDWRVDRGDASEKEHLVDMVAGLPPQCLLLADGNFVGYRIWQALGQQGRDFLIRVGGNLSLLRKLWPEAAIHQKGDLVYAWPKARRHTCPPLVLRLIVLGKGAARVHLLTNVLDRRRLSRRDAGKIYRRRWGVELFYRAFKRTLGLVKLKSKSARRARVELEWGLVACWIMTLLGINAMCRRKVDPRRISTAGLWRVLRQSLHHGRPGRDSGLRLRRALSRCLRDAYQRRGSKASRYRPRTKNTPKRHLLKPPKIRAATAKERRIAHAHYTAMAA